MDEVTAPDARRARRGIPAVLAALSVAWGPLAVSRAAPPSSQPASRPVTFAVATYNINGANRHLPKVVANIRRTDADLVCLQEVNRRSMPYLKRRLGGRYRFMAFGLNETFDGFALLSKAPITHRRWIRAGAINYHSVLHARTTLAGRAVQVVAVHLVPNPPKADTDAVGQLKHLARLEARRTRDATRIAKHFAKDLPVIALGDFNCLSFQGAVGVMKARGLIDSAAAATARPDDVHTWQGTLDGRTLHMRIDYIFHSNHLKTLASRVIHQGGSDHFPVVSTMTWAAK